jgi:serine/threonine-protein kinase
MIPMIGKSLGRYRIDEKIGEGGMGVVYRAWDERLQRDVALKVLPQGKLGDEAIRRRFRQEALALAKLSHSNIESIHDFDTQEDVDFLVMEYVPGVTLSEKLKSGPLSEQEVLRHGEQLAEGLVTAHGKGVVHRDLKPGNLRITPEGELKILDFGLAKLLRPTSDVDVTQSLTQDRGISGTLPYMAPEQLRGEPVDARTDIYAFGAVLYEMATGKRPFVEDVPPKLMDDILHQSPPSPRQLNPHLSSGLEQIILKCLEKRPDDRYQTATDVRSDLRRVGAGETTIMLPRPKQRLRRRLLVAAALLILAVLGIGSYVAWRRSRPAVPSPPESVMLAVLPFDNLSGDPERDFFSDGLTEEMITQLGSLRSEKLGVIARTSVMRYKNTDKGIAQIGQELGVDYVLEGSVRHAGDRVRITAKLVPVKDQTPIWGDDYDRDLRDILALQSEIAQAIADKIQIAVAPTEMGSLAGVRQVDPAAHEAYLKGRYSLMSEATAQAADRSIDFYQQAIEIDSDFALAYAGLAQAYFARGQPLSSGLSRKEARELLRMARATAEKALELDDELAEAHAFGAMALWFFDWDWSRPEKDFRHALKLNPSSESAHASYAVFLVCSDRYREAVPLLQRLEELDPLNLTYQSLVAEVSYLGGDYDRAIDKLNDILEVDPTFVRALSHLSNVYEAKGMYDECVEAEIKAMTAMNANAEFVAALKRAYTEGGMEAYIRKELTTRVGKNCSAKTAELHALVGQRDEAFACLEEAFKQQDSQLLFMGCHPRLAPLRSDPRFLDLCRRIGCPVPYQHGIKE